MRCVTLILLFLLGITFLVNGQTKAELEKQRKKTLDDISYVDNLLKTTEREKSQSISTIKMIANKLTMRESVISGMRAEIELLMDRIELNTLAIDMMEEDLVNLRSDYEKTILKSYRSKKGNPELVYILSSKDFNQGYKRLKYLQQIAKFRRRQTEIIMELKTQVETSKTRLQSDLNRISDLKSTEEQQKSLLQVEQEKSKRMVKSLSQKEKQLKKELQEKKRIAGMIEKEIARIIEEERKKAVKSDNTPEQRLIGENFAENRGKLPWPVEKGVITSHFGVHKHPVLKYLTEENIGVEITSSGKVKARAVFRGEVVKVFSIKGANTTIIVRHGKYLSVYANIVNVKVKPGDKVDTKDEIGDVYSDPGDNNNCVLKFMIFEEKYQDPELWISKS